MQHRYSVQVSWEMRLHFTNQTFALDNDCLLRVLSEGEPPPSQRPRRCLIFIDSGALAADPGLNARIHAWFAHHAEAGIHLAAEPQIVSGGESAKDGLAIAERVGRCCLQHGICRHSFIIIIGGGAVLDAVGLGASLVHRGVRQIRMPSTVLAQDDAGLGVKNGVNAFGNKNFFGTFQPPWAVINDAAFVALCPERERRSGLAEAVKVAIIKDARFFSWLAGHAPQLLDRQRPELLQQAIQRCAELHLDHITGNGDPFEQGSSRPLDFGHWSAHCLEVLSQHRLNHGEAVAIGIAIDCCYAVAIGALSQHECAAVLDCLETIGFRLWDQALHLRDAHGQRCIFQGLQQFREHLGGELTLAMPRGLGARQDIGTYDLQLAEHALLQLAKRSKQRIGHLTQS
ncbi:MAG: 3-dehydroquinate synthase [Planctomycetota bacterium]|nr:MAG: 3-dehydroquinate synthase [Planctomycetota bacterium]